ncbi:hypothetical protein RFI_02294 [Reticulomyxa filosa]|uniref:Uncharacterized protein n=1 Tax=Reticulomyxa filosa TaxID=46433 RepID=X6P9J8_RETFI|nr:hypothetical protein RFI_02294 [Reticulomyxa filosa]|eukprot:ETO34793.1 hypothetical protein RFI_02294 [Reticulomyxa filosa]
MHSEQEVTKSREEAIRVEEEISKEMAMITAQAKPALELARQSVSNIKKKSQLDEIRAMRMFILLNWKIDANDPTGMIKAVANKEFIQSILNFDTNAIADKQRSRVSNHHKHVVVQIGNRTIKEYKAEYAKMHEMMQVQQSMARVPSSCCKTCRKRSHHQLRKTELNTFGWRLSHFHCLFFDVYWLLQHYLSSGAHSKMEAGHVMTTLKNLKHKAKVKAIQEKADQSEHISTKD